jgi:hypothetical protein
VVLKKGLPELHWAKSHREVGTSRDRVREFPRIHSKHMAGRILEETSWVQYLGQGRLILPSKEDVA